MVMFDEVQNRPKRQVKYNEEVILCKCRKRIRLNNNGRVRVHSSGKAGSEKCEWSNLEPPSGTTVAEPAKTTDKLLEELPVQKNIPTPMFSDLQ